MKVQMDEGIEPYERVRATFEGALLIGTEYSTDYAEYEGFGGRVHVPTMSRAKFTVENPTAVWVQSIDPEKIRERITGDFPNPDAVALQEKLDEANKTIERLRAEAKTLEANYEASKVLWKKRHHDEFWIEDAGLRYIATAIAEGQPEPDPLDWD